MVSNTKIILVNRPEKNIDPDVTSGKGTFLLKSGEEVPTPKDDELLVKSQYISVDPTMRGWVTDSRSYMEPVQINEVMRAGAVSQVLKVGKDVTDVKEGDYIFGLTGFQTYSVVKTGSGYQKLNVPAGLSPSVFVGVLGMPGLTAYFGLKKIGKIQKGETVVISGGAGAVGIVAIQLAKLWGAGKVVAIAGGPEKVSFLEKETSADIVLDYKAADFEKQFVDKVGYLDVYFDNVGGDILNLALTRLNKFARIIGCGGISAYNDPNAKGPSNYLNIVMQRATWTGFIFFDFVDEFPEALKELGGLVSSGQLKPKETVYKGLANAPKALVGLFTGENIGKMVVDVTEDN